MKIRAGKRYVTRDGRVTGPMIRDDRTKLWYATVPYESGVLPASRVWEGGGIFIGKSTPHPLDLVAEYQEPGK